ncbi:hypothetical protein DL95DRAFT_461123 [Leptodontidium sp. 2 PMI_412]|nr:hypothetical protein DL95DRAFT_461123 [Leptodontidium sp. 2 PMI_412]
MSLPKTTTAWTIQGQNGFDSLMILLEEISGEKLDGQTVSVEDIEAPVAQATELITKEPDNVQNRVMLYIAQYDGSKYVRRDTTTEYAKYLGYLDSKELYPDFKPKTFRDFVVDLLHGKVARPYSNAEYTDMEDGLKTFQKAVGRVYMQGGYSIPAVRNMGCAALISVPAILYAVLSPAEGIPTPRDDAANNTFDMPAAKRFHPRLENIPFDVYTKVAAYETNIPASIFNDLGDTDHPIGKDLQNRYQRQGVQFYKTACGPNPVNGITQKRFLHDLSSFYGKHPPGKQTSEKGTPLPEDGTPLRHAGTSF